MDIKDYLSYAQMKPDALNKYLDLSSVEVLIGQKKNEAQTISDLAKMIQAKIMDIDSIDVLIRIKEAGLKFGDIINEYTDEQLEMLVPEGATFSPLYSWRIKGVVGKWTVLEDIHSVRNATRNVENFPTKNFIKK